VSRVRWGNVAQLAALVAAVALVAFGVPDGCGSEPEEIPLDALPGEPVGQAASVSPRPPRVQPKRRSRPQRRRKRLGREAAAPPPRSLVGHPAVTRHMRGWERSGPAYVPEAAREFSFDR